MSVGASMYRSNSARKGIHPRRQHWANVKGDKLLTLITDTVEPMPIYKNRPAPILSTVDRMWFRISTKICSNSTEQCVCTYIRPKHLLRVGRHLENFSNHVVWDIAVNLLLARFFGRWRQWFVGLTLLSCTRKPTDNARERLHHFWQQTT